MPKISIGKDDAFSTQVFSDIQSADYRPTKVVNPQEGNLTATLGKAIGGLVENVDTANVYKTAKTAEKEFNTIGQAFQLYADYSTNPNLGGPEKLLGKDNEANLANQLADRLDLKDKSDPAIQSAIQEFQKIANAYQSGTTAYDVVHLRAQAKLKQLMNQKPGYDKAFITAAQQTLGFDPTGSDTGAAIHALTRMEQAKNQKGGLTPEQKAQQVVMNSAAEKYGIALPYDLASTVMQQHTARERKMEEIKYQETLSGVNLNTSMQRFDVEAEQATYDISAIMAKELQSGGKIDTPEFKSQMKSMLRQRLAPILSQPSVALAGSGQKTAALTYAESRIKYLDDQIDSGAMATILTNKNNVTKQYYLNTAYKDETLGPILALGGPQGFATYLGNIGQYANNPALLDVVVKFNPQFAAMDQIAKMNYLKSVDQKVLDGSATQQEKIISAIGLKTELQQPAPRDEKGNVTSNDLVLERIRKLGTGNALQIISDAKVAYNAVTSPTLLKEFANVAASAQTQLKNNIKELVGENASKYLKGTIQLGEDGIKRIKWTFDKQGYLDSLPVPISSPNEMQRINDLENFLNNPGSSMTAPEVSKSLKSFYKVSTLYGGKTGFDETDAMLQDIIDSTTQPSGAKE